MWLYKFNKFLKAKIEERQREWERRSERESSADNLTMMKIQDFLTLTGKKKKNSSQNDWRWMRCFSQWDSIEISSCMMTWEIPNQKKKKKTPSKMDFTVIWTQDRKKQFRKGGRGAKRGKGMESKGFELNSRHHRWAHRSCIVLFYWVCLFVNGYPHLDRRKQRESLFFFWLDEYR